VTGVNGRDTRAVVAVIGAGIMGSAMAICPPWTSGTMRHDGALRLGADGADADLPALRQIWLAAFVICTGSRRGTGGRRRLPGSGRGWAAGPWSAGGRSAGHSRSGR
jgi:hypothetical protein